VRDDAGRLQDILDAIQRIEERIGVGRQRFETDEMLRGYSRQMYFLWPRHKRRWWVSPIWHVLSVLGVYHH